MKNIEIFEPAMCCSTGLCGVSVDPGPLETTLTRRERFCFAMSDLTKRQEW